MPLIQMAKRGDGEATSRGADSPPVTPVSLCRSSGVTSASGCCKGDKGTVSEVIRYCNI